MLLSLTLAASAALPMLQQQPEDGRGQALFTQEWHAGRRAALMERVSKGVVVLRGQGEADDYRPYRQHNNFWYFTGVTTPNAALVLVPDGREYLFVPEVNPRMEVWLGNLIDTSEATELTGIANCRNLSEMEDVLSELAGEFGSFYTQEQPSENWMMSRDQLLTAQRAVRNDPYDGRLSREAQFAQKLAEKHSVEVKDITVLLDGLRIVKTPEEIEAMRRACEVSGAGHVAAMRQSRPGDFEWQAAAAMTAAFLQNGARSAAYAPIVGSGPNSCILHYTENTRALTRGDVVMIDYGAEYNHFVADISRTWPVDAKFTDRQREVYEAVYAAQEAAFEQCKPGRTLADVNRAAQQVLTDRGFGRMWHSTSHWLGMATHDVGRFQAKFEPGMAFTVEPGIYIPGEGIGIRIEDVVAITETGYDLLSESIPRGIEEIEALRAEALTHAGK